MGNFFAKLKSYKLRRDETTSPPNTDENVSAQFKKSRRWQMMDKTFQWKMVWVLFILLTASALLPTQVHGQNNTDEVFFRKEKEAQVPIIMYHLVTETSRFIGRDAIRPGELKNDLQYLKDNGYNTVTMADLIKFVKKGKSLPENPIVLTFDDGNASDYDVLFPLLKEYDMKAVISIIGVTTDEMTAKYAKNPSDRFHNLTWEQIAEMHKSGIVEVQSHGYDLHGKAGSGKRWRESADTYHQRLRADLQKLQSLCEEHLGENPNTFCYPLGIISKGSQAVLEEMGFMASLSCQEGMNIIKEGDMSCLFELKRVNRPSGKSVEAILGKLHGDGDKKEKK